MKEYCAVFGVYGHRQATYLTYLGLFSLQHRGQESSGIAIYKGGEIIVYKGLGLVSQVFNKQILDYLQGEIAIGHNRYSTAGDKDLKNAQPIVFQDIAIVHNGNLRNYEELKNLCASLNISLETTTDSEVILKLYAYYKNKYKNIKKALIETFKHLKGAFSVIILDKNTMIVARDKWGFRPLVMGEKDGAYIFASETCALNVLDAKFIREVKEGEVIILNKDKIENFLYDKPQKRACIFELIYFARPDSFIFGRNVYDVRENMGRILARESYIDADVVVPIPDSGVISALGFSRESKIPFEWGLLRSHYMGRSFINPTQELRDLAVRLKLSPIKSVLNGKRVVLIDDSLVRGTTAKRIINMVRKAGAKEVHLRISSPPIKHPCFYGIDTPTYEELIASKLKTQEIAKLIGADSLAYLSIEGLLKACNANKDEFCLACFNGDYIV